MEKNKSGKIKTSVWDKVFVVCNTLFMVAFVIITLYPVLNTLAISLNDGTDALRGGIYLWPRKWTFKNYITVLQKDNLITGAYITVARTIIGTLLALVANAILAFIVSRKNFIFKRSLSLFWVVTMYVNGGMIPTYLVLRQLHLTNTLWVVILYPALNVYNLVLMRNFFEGIPASLYEAATLDGSTPMQTFVRIVLPMSKPALASIGLMYAVSYWNDYTHYKLYINNSDLYNFQMKLRGMIMGSDLPTASGNATENTIKNAAIIIVIIPFMILYPFLQKYFVQGVNIGAVKE